MSLLNYDAINLGEKDLQYGVDFLEELRKSHNLPFVSANVHRVDSNELFAKPYLIKMYDRVRVGIFGITDLNSALLVSPSSGFKVTDPMAAAQKVVNELSDKCDVVIALAHLGVEGSKVLAQQVAGIDIIVSGHDRNTIYQPVREEETVIIQTGYQGKYLGHYEFEFNSGALSLLSGKAVSLNARIQDDEKLARFVSEFDHSFVSLFPLESTLATDNNSLLSERSCARCHRNEHRQWQSTDHANAWQSLVEKNENLNSDCQKCHTTLFNQPEGFTTVFEAPYFVNVQCADCHKLSEGKNIRDHSDIRRMRRSVSLGIANGSVDFEPVSESTCLPCHDQENSPNFNYQEYLTKVSH